MEVGVAMEMARLTSCLNLTALLLAVRYQHMETTDYLYNILLLIQYNILRSIRICKCYAVLVLGPCLIKL